MVLVAGTTGLRRSESFALKWGDIDFSNLRIDVQRSICSGVVGNCKTEAFRQRIPVDERVAADLWLWKETSKYSQSGDWVFASPRAQGRLPFWPDVIMQKVIKPAAERAGLRFAPVMAYIRFGGEGCEQARSTRGQSRLVPAVVGRAQGD